MYTDLSNMSDEEFNRFAELVNNPAKPNELVKKILKQYMKKESR